MNKPLKIGSINIFPSRAVLTMAIESTNKQGHPELVHPFRRRQSIQTMSIKH